MIDKLEIALIRNIIKLLKEDAGSEALWQARKLKDFGRLESMNRGITIKLLPEIMDNAMQEVQRNISLGANLIDRSAGSLALQLPQNASPKLKAVYDGWYRKTGMELNKMAGTMLNSAKAIYTETVEQVTALNLAGTMSVRDAIRETCYQWAIDGISGFYDKAGREWSAEAYSQMMIRGTSANARREAGFARMEDLDLDLIIVSSHADARPKCADWQGQVLSLYGKTEGYTALGDTSYGEPDGLFGINCRHTYAPYTEGMKATEYDPQEVEENYKQSQIQRKLERDIRQQKKLLATSEALGDKKGMEEFSKRLEKREQNMSKFISDSGRTRRVDREEVY